MRTSMLWIAVTLLNVPLHGLASNVFRINVNDFLSETELEKLVNGEDLDATTPEFIKSHGYPAEVYEVTTEDGYILELHRIPHGKNEKEKFATDKPMTNGSSPIVFIQHGLMMTSADWVLAGPGKGLGFVLADEGYDVWLGNFRGNTYSRNHIHLDPDDKPFWKFSWDENAQYDLPAMLQYILQHTKAEKVFYIGHSMGTTSFMAMSDYHPQLYERIELASLLAPVAYTGHMRSPAGWAAPFEKQLQELFLYFGTGEFVRSDPTMHFMADLLCKKEPFIEICDIGLFMLMGFDRDQLNNTIVELIGHHSPAGTSVPTVAQYAQGVNSNKFQKYDYDLSEKNIEKYGVPAPPQYDLTKVSAPVAAYWGENDWLATPQDVLKTLSMLPNLVTSYKVPFDHYNHMDFLYAIDNEKLLYPELLRQMRARVP